MSANTNLANSTAQAGRTDSNFARALGSLKRASAGDLFIMGLWTAFAAYGLAATLNVILTY